MTTHLPEPRPATETEMIFTDISRFDPRVRLHLNPDEEEESYIEYHEDSSDVAMRLSTRLAARKGFIPDPFCDWEDNHVGIDYEGTWRLYLIQERNLMPSLEPTAYGPHSGFMEAVTP